MSQAYPEAGPSPVPQFSEVDPFSVSRSYPTNDEINDWLFKGPDAPQPETDQLEAEYPDHLVSSDAIVAEMMSRQRERAERLRMLGVDPTLDIFICGINIDNESYLARAKSHGASIGVGVDIHRQSTQGGVDPNGPMTDAELETMSAVTASKHNGRYRGRLVLGPSETKEGWRWIQAASGDSEPDSGDLDGVGSLVPSKKKGRIATTAESMVLYAERLLGAPLKRVRKGEIGQIGNGGVGGPLKDRILTERGIELGVFAGTKEQVQSLGELLAGKPLRVLFATARANGVLRADNITPPTPDFLGFSGKTLIIDAGNAPHPETNIPGGNTDTSTLPGSNVYATPFIRGVGPVTVALLFERLLDKAEEDYRVRLGAIGRVAGTLGLTAKADPRAPESPASQEPDKDRSSELVGSGV